MVNELLELHNTLLDRLPCIAVILKKGTGEIATSSEYANNIGVALLKT
jgi:hypothetical protein